MIEAIVALLTIVGALLTHFLKEKPPEVRHEEQIQDMDQAIADNDAIRISELFERLSPTSRDHTGGPGSNSPA